MNGTQPRRLANPPIKEAVVEFRFAHAKDPKAEDLVPRSPAFAAAFPNHEPIMEGTFNVKVSPAGIEPLKPTSTSQGFRYFSKDRDKAVAMTVGSMAYSRFTGYDNRDRFLAEATATVAEYLGCIVDDGKDSRVTRIGVRFINSIALPTGEQALVNLDDIFIGLPKPILDDPVLLLGVDRQMRSPTTGETSRVRLQGPVAEQGGGGSPIFILDIDVWKDLDLSVQDTDALASVHSDLFDLRSRLFFGSLHDSVLARYG